MKFTHLYNLVTYHFHIKFGYMPNSIGPNWLFKKSWLETVKIVLKHCKKCNLSLYLYRLNYHRQSTNHSAHTILNRNNARYSKFTIPPTITTVWAVIPYHYSHYSRVSWTIVCHRWDRCNCFLSMFNNSGARDPIHDIGLRVVSISSIISNSMNARNPIFTDCLHHIWHWPYSIP